LIVLKFLRATSAAKLIRLAVMLGACLCRLRIYAHSANWIAFHSCSPHPLLASRVSAYRRWV
jgi:hypothetical protein